MSNLMLRTVNAAGSPPRTSARFELAVCACLLFLHVGCNAVGRPVEYNGNSHYERTSTHFLQATIGQVRYASPQIIRGQSASHPDIIYLEYQEDELSGNVRDSDLVRQAEVCRNADGTMALLLQSFSPVSNANFITWLACARIGGAGTLCLYDERGVSKVSIQSSGSEAPRLLSIDRIARFGSPAGLCCISESSNTAVVALSHAFGSPSWLVGRLSISNDVESFEQIAESRKDSLMVESLACDGHGSVMFSAAPLSTSKSGLGLCAFLTEPGSHDIKDVIRIDSGKRLVQKTMIDGGEWWEIDFPLSVASVWTAGSGFVVLWPSTASDGGYQIVASRPFSADSPEADSAMSVPTGVQPPLLIAAVPVSENDILVAWIELEQGISGKHRIARFHWGGAQSPTVRVISEIPIRVGDWPGASRAAYYDGSGAFFPVVGEIQGRSGLWIVEVKDSACAEKDSK